MCMYALMIFPSRYTFLVSYQSTNDEENMIFIEFPTKNAIQVLLWNRYGIKDDCFSLLL